ncbi:hypothetical protein W5A_10759 [Imtechella halotolerans K1]|uniref:Uncharacterized protein n=1 Tax=Imtechella halotolerans K1 TaxID=946077 RepID=I0W9F5_9FLAO|nr:hypothetical protein W5A_10759 [Imtechella halotolerans K1]
MVVQQNFIRILAGFGLKINKLKFHYTFAKYSITSNTYLFEVAVNLQ